MEREETSTSSSRRNRSPVPAEKKGEARRNPLSQIIHGWSLFRRVREKQLLSLSFEIAMPLIFERPTLRKISWPVHTGVLARPVDAMTLYWVFSAASPLDENGEGRLPFQLASYLMKVPRREGVSVLSRRC
jgi:hypothetical protein